MFHMSYCVTAYVSDIHFSLQKRSNRAIMHHGERFCKSNRTDFQQSSNETISGDQALSILIPAVSSAEIKNQGVAAANSGTSSPDSRIGTFGPAAEGSDHRIEGRKSSLGEW